MHRALMRRVVGLLAACALPALLVATTATASFPGQNGKIVFQTDRNGNAEISTMDADGTNRVNLTRHAAADITPHWSADGQRIAFASNRDGGFAIYTMNADGTGVFRVTPSGGNDRWPSWTGDGQILFQRGTFGNRDVYLVNADGTGVATNLTPDSSDSAWAAAAPRGPSIALSRLSAAEGQRLYTMNTNSGVMKLVVPGSQEQSDYQASWSPDGNDLVFVRSGPTATDLYVVHKDGTGLRQLTNTPERDESQPAFSPDRTRIVFSACSANPDGVDGRQCANYVVNADGSGEAEVSTPRAPYLETFTGSSLDPFWHTRLNGDGSSLAQVNGQLEETFPADAGEAPDFTINAHVGTECRIGGDFDVQADFRLLTWPANGGVEVALSTFGPDGRTVRQSQAWGEEYAAWIPPTPTGEPTTDASGTLRLTRTGSTLRSWHRAGSEWHQIASGDTTLADAVVALELSSYSGRFTQQAVKVAWDEFRITSGTLTCPARWNDSAPDWQPAAR